MKTILRNFITTLSRYRTASALNIIGLSIAFAAFVIIIIQINYEWGYDKFHPKADRIYRVELDRKIAYMGGGYMAYCSRPYALAILDSVPQIESMALYDSRVHNTINIIVENEGRRNVYQEVIKNITPEFLDMFDVELVEGDRSCMDDYSKVLIPQSMAQRFFGNNSAVGRPLPLQNGKKLRNGRTEAQVGGVYRDFPSNSIFKNYIYVNMGDAEINSWGMANDHVYLTLRNADDKAAAEAALTKVWYMNKDTAASARLNLISYIYYSNDILFNEMPQGSRESTNVLLAIAFIIIIVAAINFVNFATALTPLRIRNINTRKIMGSRNGVLRITLVVEAIGMALVAYILALLIVYYMGKTSFVAYLSAPLDITDNTAVFIVTGIVALATGLFAGIYPAFYTTSFAPVLVLKGSFGLSPRGRIIRKVLVGIQFTVSTTLIICAIFMNMQYRYLNNKSIGMNTTHVVEAKLTTPIGSLRKQFMDRLKRNPAITDVAITAAPMFMNQYDGWSINYKNEEVFFNNFTVSSGFPSLMGIKVVEGRDFRPSDDDNSWGASILFNQKAKDKYGLNVGDIIPWNKDSQLEIIGFIDDANFESLYSEPGPFALISMGTSEYLHAPTAYIRINNFDMEPTLDYIRSVIEDMDASALIDVHFLDSTIEAQYNAERRVSVLITVFSILAIVISIMGIFGLVLFETAYRIKEIALRRINGASVGNILSMINRGFASMVVVCFAISVPVSYFIMSGWLEKFAYRTPLYWWVFIMSLIIVSTITVATVTFQSWRAANANPVDSLKG